jgi:hypothetical protein
MIAARRVRSAPAVKFRAGPGDMRAITQPAVFRTCLGYHRARRVGVAPIQVSVTMFVTMRTSRAHSANTPKATAAAVMTSVAAKSSGPVKR